MNMLRILLIFSLLISTQGCAAKKDDIRESSPEEKEIAASSIGHCLESKVADLDDGISDASTIANALAMRCYKEFENLSAMYVVTSDLSQRSAQLLLQDLRRTYAETALPYVLRYRNRNK